MTAEAPEAEPIPLSALQHAVYCMRQAALIHLERLWAENRLTAEGQILHLASSVPRTRWTRSLRRVTALPIASRRLGIAGVADLVEFVPGPDGERPFPIEIKRGKPKLHRADEVQLCAQALCLEEMFGRPVTGGALFYGETRRRAEVHFDADLRCETEATIARLAEVFRSEETPPAVYTARLCRACSLVDLCRPKLCGRPVASWRMRMLDALLEGNCGR